MSVDDHSVGKQNSSTYILDERRRAALAEVDNAKVTLLSISLNLLLTRSILVLVGPPPFVAFTTCSFILASWFHFRVCIVAGVGFFTDGQ